MDAISRAAESDRLATAEDWAVLLRPLLAALNSKPSREEFAARCAAIAFALPEVPADMLVGWRQRDVLRTFKFLPSPAEIREWLGDALRERCRLMALAKHALPAPRFERRPERTPEEVAAVRATVARFLAERNAATGQTGEYRPGARCAHQPEPTGE